MTRTALRTGFVAACLLMTVAPSVAADTLIHFSAPHLVTGADVAPPTLFQVDCRYDTAASPAISQPIPPGNYLAVVVEGSCQFRSFNCAQDTIWVKVDCGIPPPTTTPPCDLVIDNACIPGEGVFTHGGTPAVWIGARGYYVDTAYGDNSGTLTIALYKL